MLFLFLLLLWCVSVKFPTQTSDLTFDSEPDSSTFEVKKFSFLPKAIFEKHEEFLYLRLVRPGGTFTGTQ